MLCCGAQIPIEFKPAIHTEEAEYEEAAVDDEAVDEMGDMADEVRRANRRNATSVPAAPSRTPGFPLPHSAPLPRPKQVGDAENEEEEYYHGGGDTPGGGGRPGKLTDAILEAQVEPEAWRVELERVTPQLKMQVLSDPKEWRNRLVNTKSHQQTLQALAPETNTVLERLSDDLDRTLQAIKKAEQKLNSQCQDAVSEYVDKQEELEARMEEYNKNSDTINALTNELHSVSEDLSRIKEQMDTRGQSMTDTSPLIKIKAALSKLRTETKQLEIRIGVLTHTLTAKKVKEASISRDKEAARKNKAVDGDDELDDDDGIDDL
eukprot:scaffold85879_cov26-Tisochrysis_lutea.AAC.2